jgi:hypoxia up-regulated 1
VTREEFEMMCSDLFDRVKGPIDQALKSSGLTLDVINHVSNIVGMPLVLSISDYFSCLIMCTGLI